MTETFDRTRAWLLPSILGLGFGGALWLAGAQGSARFLWAATTVVALVPMALKVVVALLRRQPGVDLIAVLAMGSALWLGEYLAGAVIALMLTTGRALEAHANRRAHAELSALLARAPRTVSRYEDGELRSVPVEQVDVGDRLFVKSGEVVPVDGRAMDGAVLDESALTGESRPVERPPGDEARSGAVNAGSGFDLLATTTAEQSTYAGIVRLVSEAQSSKAPFVRLADHYANIFIPVTLVIAIGAWIVSNDPTRFVSVLMVATPCPLILAVPIAIISGISRAARRGIIVKSGGALETLARGQVLLFDKTGTLTSGRPRIAEVETFGPVTTDDVLRLAASVDQVSAHVLASAVTRAARERGLVLELPVAVHESQGAGIAADVGSHRVRLGKASYVAPGSMLPRRARDLRRRTMIDGSSTIFVGIDGEVAGALVVDDPVRPDTPRVLRSLRNEGIGRIVMVTGDHPDVAESVGAALGVDSVLSERAPSEKVDVVRAERAEGQVVVMVGDGINDAPALAAADVGVAMGARGATASSEAADVVLVLDRLDRLVDAIAIARRSKRIATESVFIGMGLAFGFMLLGAFGLFGPVAGAVIQELIDVSSIVNALRALRASPQRQRPTFSSDAADRFRGEHRSFGPELDRIREVADRLGTLAPARTLAELEAIRGFVVDRLPLHERQEEEEVYPILSQLLGGEDPVGSMARAHVEIAHLARIYRELLDALCEEGPSPEDLTDLRRTLYGLHAILRLHIAQEEEAYAWLTPIEMSARS